MLAPVSGALVARFGPRWMMVAGVAVVAVAFLLSVAHPDEGYATAIPPWVLLWGLGTGVAVTPLTAAVLAAIGDADLGEASGINDAASRIGGVVVIALVPALFGASAEPAWPTPSCTATSPGPPTFAIAPTPVVTDRTQEQVPVSATTQWAMRQVSGGELVLARDGP